MERRPKIALIYIDAGGGHRAAANALCEVIREQGRPWDVQMVCIQDLLDPIDFIRRSTGIPFQDVYNIMLRHGWTLGSAQLIPLMHFVIRMCHRSQVQVLEKHWTASRPDLVISLIPHYNRSLREALRRAWPETPYVTILTDIADYPPHFWIEKQDQYLICGSEHAVEQARQLGIPDSHILPTSGMILNPQFYSDSHADKASERVRLDLRPDLPTGLVSFGGEGSVELLNIARELNRADSGIQLIFVCGRHEEAARELRRLKWNIPVLVEGFTREIPFYMELADFFIGKPGPGSISEALVKHLPVIVQRNIWTLAHERFNADWIEERQVGIVIRNTSELFGAVKRLLEPENYRRFRERALLVQNNAVYEIPDLLQHVLENRTGTVRPVSSGVPAFSG